MKKTDEPGWPMGGGLPFMPFSLPGTPASPPSSLLDGMSGGIDLIKDFWSKIPGAAPLPGFLVPTVNVEELDKRIADLRAAEKWVEVNLNLLRTTIQGLEVQRHTIAAIHSLSTMADRAAPAVTMPEPMSAPAAPPAEPAVAESTAPMAAASQWLGYLQDQFSRVAGAAIGAGAAEPPTAPASKPGRKRTARKKAAPAAKRRTRRTRTG